MSFGQKNAGGYYFGHGYCNSEVLNEQILNFRLIFEIFPNHWCIIGRDFQFLSILVSIAACYRDQCDVGFAAPYHPSFNGKADGRADV